MLSQDPSVFPLVIWFCTAFFLIFRSSTPVLLPLFCVLNLLKENGWHVHLRKCFYLQSEEEINHRLFTFVILQGFVPARVCPLVALPVFVYIYIYIYIYIESIHNGKVIYQCKIYKSFSLRVSITYTECSNYIMYTHYVLCTTLCTWHSG